MEEGKTYFLRVRHNGIKYGSSNWSTTVKVSTLVPVQAVTDNVVGSAAHGGWSNAHYYAIFTNDGYLYFTGGNGDMGLPGNRYIFTNSQNMQLYAKFTNVVKISAVKIKLNGGEGGVCHQ